MYKNKKVPKVGIITWHYYPNFGSALQAYALQKYINNNGGNATLINYVNGERAHLWRIRLLLSYIDKILPHFLTTKLHYKFLAFEATYFKESPQISTRKGIEKIANHFDTFICGSDQIWAPNVFNDIYFLSFVPQNKKRYSYAASIGLSQIPNNLKPTYRKLLSNFDKISVREEQGQDLLKSEFNMDAEVVLDPTLLLTSTEWIRLAKFPKNREKYILCYFLGKNESHRKLVEELAQQTKLKIICLSRFSIDNRPTFTTDTDAGPQEFIGYINNAEYIVTDSFHGVCFSINLKKNFYVVKRFTEKDPINQNSRIINILNITNLKDRLIDHLPKTLESIDYDVCERALNKQRKRSHEFLAKIAKLSKWEKI